MKQILKSALILITLITAACRSSDYSPTASCENSSDPSCNPVVTGKIDAPTNLNAQAMSAHKIKVTWNNPSYEGHFLISLEMRENGTEAFSTIHVLDSDEATFDVESLEPLTKYFFRIKAVATEDESDYTSEVDATTLEQVVNPLFPKPTSTIMNYTVGTVKISNVWSNTTYLSWISTVQYQHKKEDGGEWETIAMGPFGTSSLQYIDNTPPKGYAQYRMIVRYTDQSEYTTAPSNHIIAVLEKPTNFNVATIEVDGVNKHLITWNYGTIPSEMSGYEILGYLPNLTQVGPQGLIQAAATTYTHLASPCPAGTSVSYWMRAKSNNPLIAPSNVTETVVKNCP